MKTLRRPISKRKAELLVTENIRLFLLKLLRMLNPNSRKRKQQKETTTKTKNKNKQTKRILAVISARKTLPTCQLSVRHKRSPISGFRQKTCWVARFTQFTSKWDGTQISFSAMSRNALNQMNVDLNKRQQMSPHLSRKLHHHFC